MSKEGSAIAAAFGSSVYVRTSRVRPGQHSQNRTSVTSPSCTRTTIDGQLSAIHTYRSDLHSAMYTTPYVHRHPNRSAFRGKVYDFLKYEFGNGHETAPALLETSALIIEHARSRLDKAYLEAQLRAGRRRFVALGKHSTLPPRRSRTCATSLIPFTGMPDVDGRTARCETPASVMEQLRESVTRHPGVIDRVLAPTGSFKEISSSSSDPTCASTATSRADSSGIFCSTRKDHQLRPIAHSGSPSPRGGYDFGDARGGRNRHRSQGREQTRAESCSPTASGRGQRPARRTTGCDRRQHRVEARSRGCSW